MAIDSTGSLAPFNFSLVIEKVPDLKALDLKMTVISSPKPVDSSNINVNHWLDIGYIIYENYAQYDGFIVLHGTDTMAYTASALSYMLSGLAKPVIFTGAQIPIGFLRSDARENLITALEIAAAKNEDGTPKVSEVCIYFNYMLLRGNRSQKLRSSNFAAFESENYPKLATAGVFIEYHDEYLAKPSEEELTLERHFDNNVAIIKLYPGINEAVLKSIFNTKGLKGVVLETFGSGNTMNYDWFLKILTSAYKKGIVIFNVSQCIGGKVIQGRYETSKRLSEIGVVSGNDITTEAAITKLMFVLGKEVSTDKIKSLLSTPLRGEMTP